MAARLTDQKKKKIVADYVQIGSYNATAKANGVSLNTVKKIVLGNADIVEMCNQKKEENTADIMAMMEDRKDKVCNIIDLYLDELLDIEKFKNLTPIQLTTAIGTLIDKWTMISNGPNDKGKEDDLSRSLKELGKELESDE